MRAHVCEHTHTHSGKEEENIQIVKGGIHRVPPQNLCHRKKTNSVLLVLFISKLGSLVVYLRNKLAGTRKLPELPSQKPRVFPDGGLVYWTGKGRKQTKHNCSHFTHIQYVQAQVGAHPHGCTKTLM